MDGHALSRRDFYVGSTNVESQTGSHHTLIFN